MISFASPHVLRGGLLLPAAALGPGPLPGRPEHRDLAAVERLAPHDGQQGVEVDVRESLGQERDLSLGVNNVPASLHQLRLLEEPANFGISSVMPLNID